MFILGIITGIAISILGLIIVIKIADSNGKKKKPVYISRGLYQAEFIRGGTDKYILSCEVGVIERTKNQSKIVIIGSMKASISMTPSQLKNLYPLIEGWTDTNTTEIEWFIEHPGDSRGEKIDKLLK